MMRRLDSIKDSMNMNLSRGRETVKDRGTWQGTFHGVTKSWSQRLDNTQQLIQNLPTCLFLSLCLSVMGQLPSDFE